MSDSEKGWGEWAWERRDTILALLKSVFGWYRGQTAEGQTPGERKPGIVIIGPGGVGKSTLGKLLSGDFDFLFDLPGAYDESLDVESYPLKNASDVEIVVPPGQPYRREPSWEDIFADLVGGAFHGVIMMAAYGYHNHGLGQMTSYKDHPLYKGNKPEFLRAFLQDKREEELKVIRQLAPHLKPRRAKLWLLTVVAKQDLWWPQRDEVERHYREGDYGAEVQRIVQGHSATDFKHELALASLVISNFTTGKNERLKPNTAGYDQELHVRSLRKLFETVYALKRWEAGT